MGVIIGLALMLATPAYLILQIACLFVAWREGWWAAFLAPLWLAAPAAAWCIFAYTQESNLWPLTFILFAPFGCLYLIVVLVLRSIAPPSSAPPAGPGESDMHGMRTMLSIFTSIL